MNFRFVTAGFALRLPRPTRPELPATSPYLNQIKLSRWDAVAWGVAIGRDGSLSRLSPAFDDETNGGCASPYWAGSPCTVTTIPRNGLPM